MNEINIHTIVDLQSYVPSYGLPKLSICGLGKIYEHELVALPEKQLFPSKTTGKQEIPISQDMERYG